MQEVKSWEEEKVVVNVASIGLVHFFAQILIVQRRDLGYFILSVVSDIFKRSLQVPF